MTTHAITEILVVVAASLTITASTILILSVSEIKRKIVKEIGDMKTRAKEKQDDLAAVAEAVGVLIKH